MSASLVPVYVLGFDFAAIATYGVIYHWHALLLWAKRAPFHRKPAPPTHPVTRSSTPSKPSL